MLYAVMPAPNCLIKYWVEWLGILEAVIIVLFRVLIRVVNHLVSFTALEIYSACIHLNEQLMD